MSVHASSTFAANSLAVYFHCTGMDYCMHVHLIALWQLWISGHVSTQCRKGRVDRSATFPLTVRRAWLHMRYVCSLLAAAQVDRHIMCVCVCIQAHHVCVCVCVYVCIHRESENLGYVHWSLCWVVISSVLWLYPGILYMYIPARSLCWGCQL